MEWLAGCRKTVQAPVSGEITPIFMGVAAQDWRTTYGMATAPAPAVAMTLNMPRRVMAFLRWVTFAMARRSSVRLGAGPA